MFIAALFTIAKKWKQPKWSLMGEWINKMWYIHTKEYYSALKRGKYCHVYNMDELDDIMLREIRQSPKRQMLYDSTYMRHLK